MKKTVRIADPKQTHTSYCKSMFDTDISIFGGDVSNWADDKLLVKNINLSIWSFILICCLNSGENTWGAVFPNTNCWLIWFEYGFVVIDVFNEQQ